MIMKFDLDWWEEQHRNLLVLYCGTPKHVYKVLDAQRNFDVLRWVHALK